MYSEQSSIIKSLGYGLLLLAILDIIVLFVPAQFMNPEWDLNLVGNLVERSPVLLIGLGLILLSGFSEQKHWVETLILKILSVSTLVLGIIFFLLIPVCVSSAWRLDVKNEAQFHAQQEQQTIQGQKLQDQVRAASESELVRLKIIVESQNSANPLSDSTNVRNNLLKELKNKEISSQKELMKAWSEQRNVLIKQATKWLLGASIVGCLFCFMWLKTKESM